MEQMAWIKQRKLWILPLSSVLLLLSSCATLTKEECITGNWRAIGYSDGVAGYTGSRLGEHNKACAKAGVSPDYQAWERGRQEGLKQYCTEANAYQIGKRGRQMNAVCPVYSTNKLQRINADGREYYALNKQIQEAQRQIDDYREEYDKLRDGNNLKFSSEKEARAYLLELPNKIQKLKQRISQNQGRINSLQRQYGY